jgi:hypothetical protein
MYTVIVRFKSSDSCSYTMIVAGMDALFHFLWALQKTDDVLEFKVCCQDMLLRQKDLNWACFDKWVTSFFTKTA